MGLFIWQVVNNPVDYVNIYNCPPTNTTIDIFVWWPRTEKAGDNFQDTYKLLTNSES